MVLEARHSVTVSGRGGTITIGKAGSHVLENEETLLIGDCVYVFEYTSYFQTGGFEAELTRYMQKISPLWTMNALLSPASAGARSQATRVPLGTSARRISCTCARSLASIPESTSTA